MKKVIKFIKSPLGKEISEIIFWVSLLILFIFFIQYTPNIEEQYMPLNTTCNNVCSNLADGKAYDYILGNKDFCMCMFQGSENNSFVFNAELKRTFDLNKECEENITIACEELEK